MSDIKLEIVQKETINLDVKMRGPKGEGVASGGLAGEVLTKASNDDFDTEWTAVGAGDMVMGVVVHGSTAVTARPSGYEAITWIGSVEPSNADNDDIWHDTSS
jgi:hypothetical protein